MNGRAQRFQSLEQTIQNGIEHFNAVSSAIFTIHNQRLYRLTHQSFQDYLELRWGMSRAHGYRLVNAQKLILEQTSQEVSPVGDIQNEHQARTILASMKKAKSPTTTKPTQPDSTKPTLIHPRRHRPMVEPLQTHHGLPILPLHPQRPPRPPPIPPKTQIAKIAFLTTPNHQGEADTPNRYPYRTHHVKTPGRSCPTAPVRW